MAVSLGEQRTLDAERRRGRLVERGSEACHIQSPGDPSRALCGEPCSALDATGMLAAHLDGMCLTCGRQACVRCDRRAQRLAEG